MRMESAVEAQQGIESAVTESGSPQITQPQIATLAQVTITCAFSAKSGIETVPF